VGLVWIRVVRLNTSPPLRRVSLSGYEKTDDVSEKTSLADQEEVRTIFINQPQLTKFCNNHVR
jgi:hypothetical protein